MRYLYTNLVMRKTTFLISKMDCPSEEKLIRMKLDGMAAIKHLEFDLPNRKLHVVHHNDAEEILRLLIPLNFGASIHNSIDAVLTETFKQIDPVQEAVVLRTLIALNAAMFLVELSAGLYAHSVGLISDGVDMLADAMVYALSLYAVGRSINAKRKAARLSGYFQITLALGILIEALRRFVYGSEAQGYFMIGFSVLALAANIVCLALLEKHKDGEVHMRASWIFSTNDVIANLGIILAGILVTVTGSSIPDLVIGALVAAIVCRGGLSILKL